MRKICEHLLTSANNVKKSAEICERFKNICKQMQNNAKNMRKSANNVKKSAEICERSKNICKQMQTNAKDMRKSAKISEILQNARKMMENKVEGGPEKLIPSSFLDPARWRPGVGPAECARPSKGNSALFCFILFYLHLIDNSFTQRSSPTGRAEFNRYAHSAGPDCYRGLSAKLTE